MNESDEKTCDSGRMKGPLSSEEARAIVAQLAAQGDWEGELEHRLDHVDRQERVSATYTLRAPGYVVTVECWWDAEVRVEDGVIFIEPKEGIEPGRD
jgi:hypothetical protein